MAVCFGCFMHNAKSSQQRAISSQCMQTRTYKLIKLLPLDCRRPRVRASPSYGENVSPLYAARVARTIRGVAWHSMERDECCCCFHCGSTARDLMAPKRRTRPTTTGAFNETGCLCSEPCHDNRVAARRHHRHDNHHHHHHRNSVPFIQN